MSINAEVLFPKGWGWDFQRKVFFFVFPKYMRSTGVNNSECLLEATLTKGHQKSLCFLSKVPKTLLNLRRRSPVRMSELGSCFHMEGNR